MCGIVGIVTEENIDVTTQVLHSLKKLEYRGYDSAGIAAWNQQHGLRCLKIAGKVGDLIAQEKKHPLSGNIAIAHTRWATHGEPRDYNAHPHLSHHKIALVHNGIIENYDELKTELLTAGYTFSSDTDSEVITHLIYCYYIQDGDFLAAVHKAINKLQGSFALAIINSDVPNTIIAVRHDSPLVIGVGTKNGTKDLPASANFISSDVVSLLELTNNFIYLEEGDIAVVTKDKIEIFDAVLTPVTRPQKISKLTPEATAKGGYDHFMLKEIYEQPQALKETLHILLDVDDADTVWRSIKELTPQIKQVQIVACGSSYHASIVGRYWCESIAHVPCSTETASEFRYRDVAIADGTLFIAISQSGETADTLAALRWAKDQPYVARLAICNVAESSLARAADYALVTHAGLEVGVAATKTFTAQLLALFVLFLNLAKEKYLTTEQYKDYTHQLKQLPIFAEQTLLLDPTLQKIAQQLATKEHVFYLARNANYPIALEGALKLKEISYLHAEAHPAGELKHGPLALVDSNTPVIVLAPHDKLWDKINANMQVVATRGGELIVLSDSETNAFDKNQKIVLIKMPKIIPILAPILYILPLQLLAYNVAILRGTNVDQPRNLAKSVTVE